MNSDPAQRRRISLRQIDASDLTFRITTRQDTADIEPSIARMGLLHPPVLHSLPQGFRVVCGFRRITAVRKLGLKSLSVIVLPPETEMFACVQWAIGENALQRPLNPIEQSRALRLLAASLPANRSLEEEAAVLGLPSNRVLVDKLRRLGRLCRPIQEEVLAERLSLPMALELAAYPEEVAAGLVKLFAALRLGLNRQREMLTLLHEIAAREDRNLGELLAEPLMQSYLDSGSDNLPAAAGRLLEQLRRRRFPRIRRRFDELQKIAASLQPGAGIRLSPPADLEAPTWHLAFGFQSIEELQDRLQRIRNLSRDPHLRKTLEEE